MRKEDLSKAIGGIDPKLVESSMAYRPAMSKHRLIKIVALAACLATMLTTLTVWGLTLTMENSKANEKIPTYKTLSSVISSENDTFDLSFFTQKEIFADLSRDNLREIFAAFDIVLEKNETIELKDTMYHRFLFDNEGIEYTLTNDVDLMYIYIGSKNGEETVLNHDGKIILSTDQDSDVLKYAMLTSVYMELFPDNWTYGYTQEDIWVMNRDWYPEITVIPDYEEYGFESAFDAFQSYTGRTENQFEFCVKISVRPTSTKMYKEISEIMENSDDSYLLELFFYRYNQSEKLNEAFAMPKKSEASK